MLHRNLARYQEVASSTAAPFWPAIRERLSNCPIFLTADLVFPYDLGPHAQLVSLQGSADYVNYRLVSNAVPTTHSVMGDTNLLRVKLDLPTEANLLHVVHHLLKTAQSQKVQDLVACARPGQAVGLTQDISTAYRLIITRVQDMLSAGVAYTDPVLFEVAQALRHQPWILMPDGRFVMPSNVCMNVKADTLPGVCLTFNSSCACVICLPCKCTECTCSSCRHCDIITLMSCCKLRSQPFLGHGSSWQVHHLLQNILTSES